MSKTNDLARRLEAARGQVRVQWTDERAAASERGMVKKKRRRAVVRAGAVAAGLVAVGAGAVFALRSEATVVVPPPEIAARPQLEVVPVGSASVVGEEVQAGRVRVTVARGPKVARLRAGVVEVESASGRFLMERADAVWVRVEEGEAVVRWPGGEARLSAGAEGWYPPAAGAAPVLQPEPQPEAVGPSKAPRAAKAAAWKRLAEAGDFTGAYDELRKSKAPVRDEPAELLLSADVSRLSHHPAEAVPPLQQVLARHASDPRAPLAAFTLGRVLLDELGQPAQAADAFARARAIAPSGPLADDALAREVEARSRAGDTARARTLAEEYLRKLPNGPRARLVRHHGGLE